MFSIFFTQPVYYLFFTMSDYQGQQHFIRNKNESTFIKVHSVNRNIWLHNSLKANWLLSAKYKKVEGKNDIRPPTP